LEKRAKIHPEKTALIFGDQVLSYAELNARANQWAHMFLDMDVKPGDRVGLLLSNCGQFIEILFALAKIDAISVLFNWRFTAAELEALCKDAGMRVIVFGQEYTQVVDSLRVRAELTDYICVGMPAPSWSRSETQVETRPSDEPMQPVKAKDPAVIIYTSGSTGTPKGATLTHENLFWWGASLASTLDVRQEDRGLLIVPLFHSMGILFTITYLMRGCTSVVARTSPFDPARILEMIRAERINNFAAAPAMLKLMSQVPRYEEYFGTVRWLISGGAHIPSVLIEEYYKHGIRVLQIYGSTETGPLTTFSDPTKCITKIGSAGPPLFLTSLKIVGEDGRELPPGRVGEIAAYGPNVMIGYWENNDATREAFRDGCFLTGDMAMMDESGYLYIVDRKKDMINSSGEHIYPAQVENILSSHPKIEDVAVVGVPDEMWGEAACAVVKTKGDVALSLQEIAEFCDGKLARFKIPRRLVLVKTLLPRSSSGKVLKPAIRELLKSQANVEDRAVKYGPEARAKDDEKAPG
jgi:acyl-CoA synthetase (AMP-forming)/AMP-acid ligase II